MIEERVKQIMSRSDVQLILSKPDKEFQEWYSSRKKIAEKLRKDYETLEAIPHLYCPRYTSDHKTSTPQDYYRDGTTFRDLHDQGSIVNMIGELDEIIEHLDLLKKIKEGFRGDGAFGAFEKSKTPIAA